MCPAVKQTGEVPQCLYHCISLQKEVLDVSFSDTITKAMFNPFQLFEPIQTSFIGRSDWMSSSLFWNRNKGRTSPLYKKQLANWIGPILHFLLHHPSPPMAVTQTVKRLVKFATNYLMCSCINLSYVHRISVKRWTTYYHCNMLFQTCNNTVYSRHNSRVR